MEATWEAVLRRIALGDERVVAPVASMEPAGVAAGQQEQLAAARLGALLAIEPATSVLQIAVSDALLAGLTPARMVSVLLSITPIIGLSRAATAAPRLGLAIGYDIDAALE